ncbi:MAG: PspC domain-containing protein [Chitinophagaceae bacterium]|nr:PspC domain-containing protein [Chitinophagaceae bacterium]
MKKVININFKGRVIPIEETAFEQLQQYIESLRRYFANEEGRDEIINDIEDRIAELFDEDLKKGNACITDESVNNILNSMGRVEDFAEMDNEPSLASGAANGGSKTYSSAATDEPRGSMSRNANDKVLGGVCSGIAHYLKIDPTIIRVLFVLFTLGYGTGLLIYIILWAVLPQRELKSNIKKRLFRDPDQRVIGGVAGGLANYFNIAVWIPRIVFLSPIILGAVGSLFRNMFFWGFDSDFPRIFLGAGLGSTLFFTYIILWIVLPKASSAADKLQMRGEKIDVGSISKAVKEDLKKMGDDVKSGAQRVGEQMKEGAAVMGEEVKERAQAFASEARPVAQRTSYGIANAIGMLFKIFFLFIAGIIAFCLLMILFGFTIIGVVAWPLKDYVIEGGTQNFAIWGTLVFFLLVPAVAFFVWVVRKIFGIKSKRSYLGYVFGALWLVGWVCLFLLISTVGASLSARTEVPETISITQPADKMVVTVSEPEVSYSGHYWWIHEDGDGGGWDVNDDSLKLSTIRPQIEQSNDSNYSVQIVRRSYGQSKQQAADKANKISYKVNYKDGVLDLGSYMAIAKTDKFRGQHVNVVIKIPVGKKIVFEKSVARKLNPVNYRFTQKNRWNRMSEDWDVDVYTDFEYSSDVDYIMTVDGLRRVDGKDKEKYKYNKNGSEDKTDELKDIEREKEELKQREDELKKNTDSSRYRYQPGGNQKPDTTKTKAIASYKNTDAVFHQPITVSAL